MFVGELGKGVGMGVRVGMRGRVDGLNEVVGFWEGVEGMGSRLVRIIGVIEMGFGIDGVGVVEEFELGGDSLIDKLGCRVLGRVEVVLYVDVMEKVEIDFVRKVDE